MTKDDVTVLISKPVARVLQALTHESNLELAIVKVLQQLLEHKIKTTLESTRTFEKKYGLTFSEYERACEDGRIADPYSYEVEQDGFNWEASVSEQETYVEMRRKLEAVYPSPPTVLGFSR